MTRPFVIIAASLVVSFSGFSQGRGDIADSTALLKIKTEGLSNSNVMEYASWLSDVHTPRLTWSPGYLSAAKWVSKELASLGLVNIHFEKHGPVGKGWTLKEFTASMTEPVVWPLIAFPKAWSPDVDKEADVVYLDVRSLDDFKKYEGKLKGKYVLMNDIIPVKPPFEAYAERTADSILLRMANADVRTGRRGGRGRNFPRIDSNNFDSVMIAVRRFMPTADSATVMRFVVDQQVTPKKLEFVQQQGALAAISAGRGDGGTMPVQGAAVPQSPNVPYSERVSPYDVAAPEFIPQVVVAAEHYNRLVRMVQKGEKVKVNIECNVEWTKADSSFNIIAEIPGTDLKDEVVLIGGHFDTWHAGTGATDNTSGTAVCLEALRIIQSVIKETGVKPRRTIRIGLWGGEEQGLYGSAGYVSAHYGKSEGMGGGGSVQTLPEHENFSVYFNHDNGTGRIRGMYMQGNEGTRPIFRSWLSAFGDPTAQTLTIANTGGTDHQSFDGVGLPGFQFIQDQIDYSTRTHHYNMDLYDRLIADDLKQGATIMAWFTYNAAMRDSKFPRKAMPGAR
jgi:carboxypeptidase Q